MTINHGEHMHYYIMQLAFHDSFLSTKPSQPYSYAYGDRPVFEFCFLPDEIAEGDTLVFAVDNDMVFYDSAPENILHSASCMVMVRHDVTAEEATAGKVQMRIETRTLKFRDTVNGKVRPVEVISGLYRRRGNGDDLSYVLLARGRAFANGIIADYDALPEPITIDEYYTKGDIDGRLGEKADAATLVAHTDNSDIHVTLQDKTTWDSKADIGDIGNATVTITQDGVSKGSFSVNASENVTIDLTGGGAQADWNETDTTSPAYIQHKPSVYTKTETDGMLNEKADKATTYTKTETDGLLDAKADKTSVYTKTETDGLLDAKANVATTLSGYGIQDAYTKVETNSLLDAKADKASTYTKTETDGLLDVKANVATTLSGYGIQDAYTKTETDGLLDEKANVATTYTKTDTDVLLDDKADKATTYTKTETDASLDAKADKASVYTKGETNSLLDAKADKATTYTKGETDGLLNAKADKATTLAGYGIADAYTKTEVDAKVTSVYRYKGTVSTYADLPSSGQEVGDVWNIETADSTHGIKAGDNVAWNGTTWDVLAGEIDLTAYPTKSELATVATTGSYNDLTNRPDLTTKLDAPAVAGTVGQVLTKTANGQEWADAPAGGGGGGENTTDYLCFTADEANDTISLNKYGTPHAISLEYSVDKKTWTEYTWDGNTGATITLVNIGDSVYFRGNNDKFSASYDNYYNFQFSALTRASGNIMSLLDKQFRKKEVTEYCFNVLFYNCTSLTTAPELPATTLAESSYYNMFSGSGIVVAPELPATTLAGACYRMMFNGCTSLTTAPELPATTLANWCYYEMFKGCTSLTTAPELPATTIGESSYRLMFNGCTSLTTAPKIYAKSGDSNSCNSMFYNCTSLTEATVPNLNLNISNVNSVFQMFYGCTSLKHLKVYFTNWDGYGVYIRPWDQYKGYSLWLEGASSTGVFECPSALDCSIRDDSHVPAGWTIVRTDSPKSITSPITASSEATYQVSPNTPDVPVVTVASALTLKVKAIDSGSIAYAEIVLDVATGATVTAGINLTLVDTPTAGKRNICVVRWSNGVAKLYVTIVEDLPQA